MPRSNSLTGPERYNFMLALTGYLINRGQVPISEVAKRFDVSVPELRSALVTISLSGVGRYGPDELFFLDYELLEEGIVELSFAPTIDAVPRLSTKQAAAIASGLSFLHDIVDESDKAEIEKILGLLREGSFGKSELRIEVQAPQSGKQLSQVRDAIARSLIITCDYMNNSGVVSSREIEPLFLQSEDSIWFLKGFCRQTNSLRVFRLDRMRDVVITDQKVSEQARGLLVDESIYVPSSNDTEVWFEIDEEGYGFVVDFKPEQQLSSGTVKVSIPIGEISNLPRIIAKYNGHVRVLAPESARQVVREFAHMALGEFSPNREEVE